MTRIGQSGGGLQNALSFLGLLPEVADKSEFIVAAASALVHSEATRLGYEAVTARRFRGLCELDWCCRGRFAPGQMCFTFFGHPWRQSAGYLVNVTGVALSNLFYPEVPFWCHLPRLSQWRRFFIDWFRYKSLCLSDYWVFETEVLRKRAIELAGFPEQRVSVVRMSPSALVCPETIDPRKRESYERRLPSGHRLLFLAEPNPNKRIHLAAEIVRNLEYSRSLDRPVNAVTTLDPHSAYWRTVRVAFQRAGVFDRLCNIGPIQPSDVSSLMSCCHAVCLFSVLESFSNNMVEAWNMGLPLVVTDADWARDAAGEAALYITPDDAASSARRILPLLRSEEYVHSFVVAGKAALKRYPAGREKTKAYLTCIEHARALGHVKEVERGSVKQWLCLCRSRPRDA